MSEQDNIKPAPMESEVIDTTIPESFQAKLFDVTGPSSGGGKGYVIFYLNQNGDVSVLTKTEHGAGTLALRKAIELFVKDGEMVY